MAINWNNGNRISLKPGDTATCSGNIQNQSNAIFLYNQSGNDHDIKVTVTSSNRTEPLSVNVPGTTGHNGLATLVLFSGTLTNTVAVSVNQTNVPDSVVDAWIGSKAMPTYDPHLNNAELPADGQKRQFNKYDRYYFVPESHWYTFGTQSNINQFYYALFGMNDTITVCCLNPGPAPKANVYFLDDDVKKRYNFKLPDPGQPQFLTFSIFGDGSQYVAMNADSGQNSEEAAIWLQSLSAEFFEKNL